MDCGVANDFLCRFSAGLLQPNIDLSQWLGTLKDAWAGTSQLVWRLVEMVFAHAEKLFGLAGFAFGVWRWWYTREKVLHKRLQEYIVEQDRRLGQARTDVLEAIHRPGPKQEFADPLFAVRPLRRLLRRRRWGSLFDLHRIETSAERNLEKALSDIERRYGIAVAALTSLRAQMASAYLLQGAIAAARASQSRNLAQRMYGDDKALTYFRTVLQVHDYDRDVQAKEYEAHQLRKLGHLPEADSTYEELEALTAWISNERTRNLTLARARRHRAQIAQAQHIWEHQRGLRGTSICPIAHRMMNDAQGALALRRPYGPFRDWEAIEQGECHYVGAFVCHHFGAHIQEQTQLSFGETIYKGVLNQNPTSWFMGSRAKRLRSIAQTGLDRVQRAQTSADYDTDWLLPPSQQPQSPTSAVGSASG